MDDFYRELIVDRYKNPIFKGNLDPHNYSYEDENPLCGDHIKIELQVDQDNIITNAAFSGHGCAISQASADLLLESVVGKKIDEVKKITKETILDLLGIELGPVRLKCALLSLKVLKAGIYGIGEIDEELLEI
ncbi:MAG: SUF system NifU family Fe-S cluster assembly protein [Anaerolineaceae bacterium]|nr:SUF system NifU family Fe-S cluster assembly protein [Anaerolineaceae bacterium]